MKKILLIFLSFIFIINLYADEKCNIVILPFANQSDDYWYEEYGIDFSAKIINLFGEIENLNIIDMKTIYSYIEDKYFSIDAAAKDIKNIAGDFNADYIVTGFLFNIHIRESDVDLSDILDIDIEVESQVAESHFNLTIYNIKDGKRNTVSTFSDEAYASAAQVTVDFVDAGKDVSEDTLIEQSLRTCALKAMLHIENIIFNEKFSGIVKNIYKKEIYINGGKQLNMKTGNKLTFYSIESVKVDKDGNFIYDKKEIGKLPIIKSKSLFSICKEKLKVNIGDRVVLSK